MGGSWWKLCRGKFFRYARSWVGCLPVNNLRLGWAVGDDGSTQLSADIQEGDPRVLDIECHGVVLDLNCSDRVDSIRPTKSSGKHFAQTNVSDFTLPVSPRQVLYELKIIRGVHPSTS